MEFNINKADANKFGIYAIKNFVTNCIYIGQTSVSFLKRY